MGSRRDVKLKLVGETGSNENTEWRCQKGAADDSLRGIAFLGHPLIPRLLFKYVSV